MTMLISKNSVAFRLVALGAVLFMVASLFIGGAQPGAVGLFHAPVDKLVHTMYFFVMAFLLVRFVRLPVLFVIMIISLVGVCDELHQMYLPGRQAGLDDLLADAVGVLLAIFVFKLTVKDAA